MSSSPSGDMSVQPQGQLIIFPMNYVEVSLVYTFSLGIACYDYILLVGRRVVVTWWWEESNILRMESVLTQVASV